MFRMIAYLVVFTSCTAVAAKAIKVGDRVAAIKTAPVALDEKEVGQLKPGSTARVIRVEKQRVYIDHDSKGWVPAGAVRTLDDAEEHFITQLNKTPEPQLWSALETVRDKKLDDLLDSLVPTTVSPESSATAVTPAMIAIPRGYEHVRRARELLKQKKYNQALRKLDRALQVNPNLNTAVYTKGKVWEALGEDKKAIAEYTDAIRRRPKDADAYHARAWVLAISTDDEVRNGAKAVSDALSAARLFDWRSSALLDTLAAAYAEAGDFKKAIGWQEIAIQQVSEDTKDSYKARLELYREGKPFRTEKRMTERHEVDLDFCLEVLKEHRENWSTRLKYIPRTPDNLNGFATHALSIVQYASVVEPDAEDISKMLKTAAQASAALFVVDQAGGKRVEVRLGDLSVVYEQRVDESLLHASKWLQAFYLALICRENDLLDALCKTPVGKLRKSSTTHPEYQYLLVHALQGWWTEADDTAKRFVAALRETDPESDPRIVNKDWTLYIDVPLMEVAFRCVTDDARFEAALSKAVGLHKQYYSANEDRKDDRRGFISIALTAMAAVAHDRDLKFTFQSDYLPVQLVTGNIYK